LQRDGGDLADLDTGGAVAIFDGGTLLAAARDRNAKGDCEKK
jgi:hypothetical protein